MREATAVLTGPSSGPYDLGVESLPLVFSSGWASGINAYLVVLVLGHRRPPRRRRARSPTCWARWDVLAVAGFMFAMEFVADKIPYIDSTWDAISTAIRPTVGAVIGVLLAGDATTLDQAVLGVVGGGTALLSHSVKAGSRLAINSSPEPVTNVAASVTEDVAVLAVVWFAIDHPRAAAAIAAVLLVLGLVVLYFIARLIRRGWRRWKKKDPLPADAQGRAPRAARVPPWRGWWWSAVGSAGWPRPPGWPSSATR